MLPECSHSLSVPSVRNSASHTYREVESRERVMAAISPDFCPNLFVIGVYDDPAVLDAAFVQGGQQPHNHCLAPNVEQQLGRAHSAATTGGGNQCERKCTSWFGHVSDLCGNHAADGSSRAEICVRSQHTLRSSLTHEFRGSARRSRTMPNPSQFSQTWDLDSLLPHPETDGLASSFRVFAVRCRGWPRNRTACLPSRARPPRRARGVDFLSATPRLRPPLPT